MRPTAARSEEDIADAVEAWEREENEVRRLDPGGEELPDAWRMTALKCILVGRIKEHVEITAGRYTQYEEMRKGSDEACHAKEAGEAQRAKRKQHGSGRSRQDADGIGSSRRRRDRTRK